jgi:hypothetical protein
MQLESVVSPAVADLLRVSTTFRRLQPVDRQRLAEVARAHNYPKGSTIFGEGEPSDFFGLYLLFAQRTDVSLRLAIAYGVFGLVGFLAQMVVGMQAKLVPMLAWYRALAASNFKGPMVPPFCDGGPAHPGGCLHRLGVRGACDRGRFRAERDSSPVGRRMGPAGWSRPVGCRQLGCCRPGAAGSPAVVAATRADPEPTLASR